MTATLQRFLTVVAGEARASDSERWLPSTNPYTGLVWAEVPHGTVADADAAVEADATETGMA